MSGQAFRDAACLLERTAAAAILRREVLDNAPTFLHAELRTEPRLPDPGRGREV